MGAQARLWSGFGVLALTSTLVLAGAAWLRARFALTVALRRRQAEAFAPGRGRRVVAGG